MSVLLEFPIKGLFPGRLAATFRAQGQNRADLRRLSYLGTGISLNRGVAAGQGSSATSGTANLAAARGPT